MKPEPSGVHWANSELNGTRTFQRPLSKHWLRQPELTRRHRARRTTVQPSPAGLAVWLVTIPVWGGPGLSSGVLACPQGSCPVLAAWLHWLSCGGWSAGAAADATLVCATAGRWRRDGSWSHCPGSSWTMCRPIGITCILLKDQIPGLQQPQQIVRESLFDKVSQVSRST